MSTNAPLAGNRSAQAAAAALAPQLAAAEREHDRDGSYPASSMARAREAGLLAVNVPESFGGFGEELSGTVETLRTVAQSSPSTALMLTMHACILANYAVDPQHIPPAERAGFLRQRDWAFGEAAAGKIFAVANSEAGAGGNVKNSRAEVRGGALSGTKSFCSIGTHADYYMAAARDEDGTVEYWLVANDAAHVAVAAPWDAVGMRASESVSLRFDGARVLGPLAYRGLLDGVNKRHWSTLAFTAVFIGIGESLLDDFARSGSGVLQKTTAVDLHLAVQASLAFLRHCVDAEPEVSNDAYRRLVRDCKLFTTRALVREATAAYAATSGAAYRFDAPIARKLRDLLAGPALRPPVGITFDEVWEEMAR